MKTKHKVLILSFVLANFINVQATQEPIKPTQKLYKVHTPITWKTLFNIYWNRPCRYTLIADCTEPIILENMGYSNSEIYNKMISERMFALSIASIIYPPAAIPIAISLYTITNPRENTWTEFNQDIAIKAIIGVGLTKVLKK